MISVLVKTALERVPPAQIVALCLADLGYQVQVFCGRSNNDVVGHLRDHGVEVLCVRTRNRSTTLARVRDWLAFRRAALAAVRKLETDEVVWVVGAATALAIYPALRERRHVLHLLELHDNHPFYRRNLSRCIQGAGAVVVPEYNRAVILRSWLGLPRTPTVLPNKPWDHPRQRDLPSQTGSLGDLPSDCARIVLYQGHIGPERPLAALARAVRMLGDQYTLVLMGHRSKYLEELEDANSRLIHIPFVPAPFHLQVTSRAHIGVVTYDYSRLNHVFCAPNKIWEYAGFGVPMLCEDLPGLRSTVGEWRAGVLTDMMEEHAVLSALETLTERHQELSDNAAAMFDSPDVAAVIKGVLLRC